VFVFNFSDYMLGMDNIKFCILLFVTLIRMPHSDTLLKMNVYYKTNK
jgi:hypothetical protein